MTQADIGRENPTAIANFSFDDALAAWNTPAREWLTKNEKHWDGLATANLVFDRVGRLLLLQRAAHDSMPNRWEIPGGAVDDDDPSILYGAARELWEESGLAAQRFTALVTTETRAGEVPGFVFTNRHGTRFFCRFTFVVDVESYDAVKLDPNEHQDFVWATEDEVRAEKMGDRVITITNKLTKEHMLEGFSRRAAGSSA